MALYLTYDNDSLKDGFGAQILRIFGIYSLARFTRCKYMHTPICETIEEFAHDIKDEGELEKLKSEVNKFFELPSDNLPSKFDKVITIRSLGLKRFLSIYIRYKYSRKTILLRILLPYGCTEKFPSINRIAAATVRERNLIRFKNHPKMEIVIHARLGYGQRTAVSSHVRPRHLPIAYYVNLINKVSKYFSTENSQTKVIVHTDLASKSTTWKPTKKRLLQNIEFGEEVIEGTVNVEATDLSTSFVGNSKISYEFRYCDEFFTTFLDLACANNLILSRSSFSYLAALFNDGNVIWPDNHGHARLQRWKSSKDYEIKSNFDLIQG